MSPVMHSEWIDTARARCVCVLVLTVGLCVLRASGSVIVFPEERPACKEGFACRDITLCATAIAEVRRGGRPPICGWHHHVAKVCCPVKREEDDDDDPFFTALIGFRRPAECGVLVIPQVNASSVANKTTTTSTAHPGQKPSKITRKPATRPPALSAQSSKSTQAPPTPRWGQSITTNTHKWGDRVPTSRPSVVSAQPVTNNAQRTDGHRPTPRPAAVSAQPATRSTHRADGHRSTSRPAVVSTRPDARHTHRTKGQGPTSRPTVVLAQPATRGPERWNEHQPVSRPGDVSAHPATRGPERWNEHQPVSRPGDVSAHSATKGPERWNEHQPVSRPEDVSAHPATRGPEKWNEHQPPSRVGVVSAQPATRGPEKWSEHQPVSRPGKVSVHPATRGPEKWNEDQPPPRVGVVSAQPTTRGPDRWSERQTMSRPGEVSAQPATRRPQRWNEHQPVSRPGGVSTLPATKNSRRPYSQQPTRRPRVLVAHPATKSKQRRDGQQTTTFRPSSMTAQPITWNEQQWQTSPSVAPTAEAEQSYSSPPPNRGHTEHVETQARRINPTFPPEAGVEHHHHHQYHHQHHEVHEQHFNVYSSNEYHETRYQHEQTQRHNTNNPRDIYRDPGLWDPGFIGFDHGTIPIGPHYPSWLDFYKSLVKREVKEDSAARPLSLTKKKAKEPFSETQDRRSRDDDSGINETERGRSKKTGKVNARVPDPNIIKAIGPALSFVVGGHADYNTWPWMAAILKGSERKFLCGGFLINERYVLTAAHCFEDHRSSDTYAVRLGQIRVDEGPIYRVERFVVHEDYVRRQYYNDIAMLRLAKPVPLALIRPVCLPAADLARASLVSKEATVLGWGDTMFGGPRSDILQEVNGLPIVDVRQCNESYSKLRGNPFNRGITKEFICAGLAEGGKDACQGDSGGPLMLEHEGRWTALGIVSFGYRCGEPGFPGVYTRISRHLRWIDNNIYMDSVGYNTII